MATAAAEEKIVLRRVLAKEQSIKKIATRVVAFKNALKKGNIEELESLNAWLSNELTVYEFGMSKVSNVCTAATKTLESYAKEEAAIDDRTKEIECDILRLNKMLLKEREHRKHKEQYDSLVGSIHKHTPRDQSAKKLQRLKDDIVRLEEEAAVQTGLMELRSKQFHSLLATIQALTKNMDEDAEVLDTLLHDRSRDDTNVSDQETELDEEEAAGVDGAKEDGGNQRRQRDDDDDGSDEDAGEKKRTRKTESHISQEAASKKEKEPGEVADTMEVAEDA
eukprot:Rmarinus@m.9955